MGDKFSHYKYGEGIVCDKTARTITIVFENGMKCKNTYRYSDAYFSIGDF